MSQGLSIGLPSFVTNRAPTKRHLDMSKVRPVETKCLIKLEPVEDITSGGIMLPDEVRTRNQMAQMSAVLVAAGDMAFADWEGRKPMIGQRILVAKYSGQPPAPGEETYRLCQDQDVVAVIED